MLGALLQWWTMSESAKAMYDFLESCCWVTWLHILKTLPWLSLSLRYIKRYPLPFCLSYKCYWFYRNVFRGRWVHLHMENCLCEWMHVDAVIGYAGEKVVKVVNAGIKKTPKWEEKKDIWAQISDAVLCIPESKSHPAKIMWHAVINVLFMSYHLRV